MRLAFILSESVCASPFNGIRIQAETWANELQRQGHEVVRVNPWEQYDWQAFDAIHLFGYCSMLNNLAGVPNTHIFFSPIIDSFQPIWKYRLATYWGCRHLRLTSHNYEIRQAAKYVKIWCVRSQFEYEYVRCAYGIDSSQIAIVPLSYRIEPPLHFPHKDPYCLHVSKISDARKNVERLVDAAVKFHFKLVLAGSVDMVSYRNSSLRRKIEAADNVTYLGRVSDCRLFQLYCSAKVFALPSIGEGVGMVALEAAACGCEIVVTDIGGPKEYYNGLAYVVNPYNIDAIGTAVTNALSSSGCQPRLMKYVTNKYCLRNCVNGLIKCYNGQVGG